MVVPRSGVDGLALIVVVTVVPLSDISKFLSKSFVLFGAHDGGAHGFLLLTEVVIEGLVLV